MHRCWQPGAVRFPSILALVAVLLSPFAAQGQTANLSDEQIERITRGLASFVISRAQQDATDALIERTLRMACASGATATRDVIPATCRLYDGDAQLGQAVTMSAEYRATLAHDLAAFPQFLADKLGGDEGVVAGLPNALAGLDRRACEQDPQGCLDRLKLVVPAIQNIAFVQPSGGAPAPVSSDPLRLAIVMFGRADSEHVAAAASDLAAAIVAAWQPGAHAAWVPAVRTWTLRASSGDARAILEGIIELQRTIKPGGWQVDALGYRLLSLAASLSDAQSDADVQSILEAFAPPPGSARARAERPTAAVAGWLGAAGGIAMLTQGGSGASATFAPSLQIGLDFTVPACSIPNGKTHCTGAPIGLFVSLLELGNLVRWSDYSQGFVLDNSAAQRPGVASFLSPGLYARISWPSTPFVLAAGATFIPDFRRSSNEGGSETSESAVVVQVFVGASVDLLSF